MEKYLQFCRSHVSNIADFETIHFVIGNESCDLDSSVSAVVLAYTHYLQQQKKHEQEHDLQQNPETSKNRKLIIPLLNVSRRKLCLRTEIVFWFNEAAKIDLKRLICKDEIDWLKLKKSNCHIVISLVDHNDDPEMESLGEIVKIIDHHKRSAKLIENFSSSSSNSIDIEIDESVGSCSTLVAKRYFDSLTTPSSDLQQQEVDVQVALLLYGPIILDTVCFSESAKRFNDDDKRIVCRLERVMGSTENDNEPTMRHEVYQQLITAKNKQPEGLHALLEKDLKFSVGESNDIVDKKVAIASISGQLACRVLSSSPEDKRRPEFLSISESTLKELDEFRIESRSLGVILLGIRNEDPTRVERDVALFFTDLRLLEKMSIKLESTNNWQLGLKHLASVSSSSSRCHLKMYRQENLTASRKVILPIVTSVLSEEGIPSFQDLTPPTPTSPDAVEGAVLEGLDASTSSVPQSPIDGGGGVASGEEEESTTYATPSDEEEKPVKTIEAVTTSKKQKNTSTTIVDHIVVESKTSEGVSSSLQVPETSSTSTPSPIARPTSSTLNPNDISTADVDPDFLLEYRPETVDFPESPRLLSPINRERSNQRNTIVSLTSSREEVMPSSPRSTRKGINNSNTTTTTTNKDTVCFSESAKRFNDDDKRIVCRLERVMGSTENDNEPTMRHEVYQQLITAKNKQPEGLHALLEKDLKFSVGESNDIVDKKVAIASISGQLACRVLSSSPEDKRRPEFLSISESTLKELDEFRIESRSLGVILLGIRNEDPTRVERDVALFFTDLRLLEKMSIKLESTNNWQLGLKHLASVSSSSSRCHLKMYRQENLTASRKVILPIVTSVLSEEGIPSFQDLTPPTPTSPDAVEAAVLEGLDASTSSVPQSPIDGGGGVASGEEEESTTYATPSDEEEKPVKTIEAVTTSKKQKNTSTTIVDHIVVESKTSEGVSSSLQVPETSSTSTPSPIARPTSSTLNPNDISTADVDPDFLLEYRPETVDFPESPRLLSPINRERSNQRNTIVSLTSSREEVMPSSPRSTRKGINNSNTTTTTTNKGKDYNVDNDHDSTTNIVHDIHTTRPTTATHVSLSSSSSSHENSSKFNNEVTDRSRTTTTRLSSSSTDIKNNITTSNGDSTSNHQDSTTTNANNNFVTFVTSSSSNSSTNDSNIISTQRLTANSVTSNGSTWNRSSTHFLHNQLSNISTTSSQHSNSSQHSQQQLPSINLYESYFDDSYVGDFSGDVDDTLAEQSQLYQNLADVQSRWCTDPDLINPSLLEFTYDSFGPESIVFTGVTNSSTSTSEPQTPADCDGNSVLKLSSVPSIENNPTTKLPSNIDESENLLMSLSVTEPQLKDKLKKCFDNSSFTNGYGKITIEEDNEESKTSKPSSQPSEQENHHENITTSAAITSSSLSINMTAHDDDDVVGGGRPLPTKPINGSKKETKDSQEPRHDEEIISTNDMKSTSKDADVIPVDVICVDSESSSMSTRGSSTMSTTSPHSLSSCASPDSFSSEDKSMSTHNFSRNSTLTKSQRKKISPKINFEQILNASDEPNNMNGLLLLPSKLSSVPLTDDDSSHHSHHHQINSNISNNDVTIESSSDGGSDSRCMSNMSIRLGKEGSSSRYGSLQRKKITVNKDVLNYDDIHLPQSREIEVANDRNIISHAIVHSTHDGHEDDDNIFGENGRNTIPVLPARHEVEDSRRWKRSCPMGSKGESRPIDLKVIEPYKRVISHAGYLHHYNSVSLSYNSVPTSAGPAIITFSACFLPDRSRKDYHYVMDHLFLYVLTTLHELIADDYILIYFHNPSGSSPTTAGGNNMPTFSWLKRCYHMIDRKLRKNLKALYLVHPTFWLKTLVIMTKPLLSSKFSRKLRFVSTLKELNELVPLEHSLIPAPVKQVDFENMIRGKKKNLLNQRPTIQTKT